jgi:hypothetical protein
VTAPVDDHCEHFTRLWPTSAPGRPADAPLFLAAVSPLRLLALAVLWVTSSAGRLVIGLTAAAALAVVLLIVL